MGDATLGARLLTIADPLEAQTIAAQLDQLNRERQELERFTLEKAEAALGGNESSNAAVVVAAGRGWHPGLLGLVAARLKERFRRPAFAVAFNEEGIGAGSGRS